MSSRLRRSGGASPIGPGRGLNVVNTIVSLLLAFLVATVPVAAQEKTNGVDFLFPPFGQAMTFYYMDTIEVKYTSPFPQPKLYTWCLDGSVIQKDLQDVTPFNGSALVVLDFTNDAGKCWFNLRPNTTAGFGRNSEQWTLISTGRSKTTIAASLIASTTAASSGASTISPSPSPTAAGTGMGTTISASASSTGAGAASTTSSSSGGISTGIVNPAPATEDLSTGAKAGIGVGVAFGVMGFASLIATIFLRRRRRDSGEHERLHTGAGSPRGGGGGPSTASTSNFGGSGPSQISGAASTYQTHATGASFSNYGEGSQDYQSSAGTVYANAPSQQGGGAYNQNTGHSYGSPPPGQPPNGPYSSLPTAELHGQYANYTPPGYAIPMQQISQQQQQLQHQHQHQAAHELGPSTHPSQDWMDGPDTQKYYIPPEKDTRPSKLHELDARPMSFELPSTDTKKEHYR